MPAIADLTSWRSHPQMVRGWLWVHIPTRICRRRVNQASFAYPVTQLTFDNPDSDTGDTADITVDMTVKVSSSVGTFKGWGRIRKAVSGATMYIAPVGQGDLDFGDNDILDIYEEYRPYALIPYINPTTGALFKDYDTAYSAQNLNIPPVANCEVDVDSLFVSGSPAVITVNFNANTSYVMADGAAIHPTEPYTWDLGDGTRTVGGEHDSAITATFPEGFRYVKLTVKDSNNVTTIKYIPLPALTTSSSSLYKVKAGRIGGTLSQGWEASFTLYEDDLSTIPDHALVIYFEEEYWNGTKQPLGTNCIRFKGWLTNEIDAIQPYFSDTTVNATGPLGILQQRPAFPQTVELDDTPAAWNQVDDLTWWRTVIYLLMWHSNILKLCDLSRPAFYDDHNVVRLDSELGTLYDQIQWLARAEFAQFTADQRGILYLRRNPQFMTTAERAALASIVTLTSADIVGQVELSRAHWPTTAWARAAAIVASSLSVVAVQAISPGTMPGQGPGIDDLNNLLVTNQADLNLRLGHYYAQKNRRYSGANTWENIRFTLAHRGGLFDPAWQEWVTLTLASSTNRRGVSFSATRCVIKSCEITIDGEIGTSAEVLTVEDETSGAAATTVVVPTDGIIDIPIPTWDDPPVIDVVPTTTTVTPDLVYAGDETDIKRSRDFTTAATWETVVNIPTLAGVGYKLYAMCTGHSDGKNRMQIVVADGTTTLKIYETTNLDTTADWTLKKTISLATYRVALYNPPPYAALVDTWFLFHQRTGEFGSIYHTHNNWVASTDKVDEVSGFASPYAFAVSAATTNVSSGVVAVGNYNASMDQSLRLSVNYGGTFTTTLAGLPDYYNPVGCMIPWIGNGAENILYAWGGSSSTKDAYLYKTINRSSWSDITPSDGGVLYGGGHRNPLIHDELHSYTPTPAKLSFIGQPSLDQTGGNQKLCVSDTGSSPWTFPYEFTTVAHTIGGWPYLSGTLFISGASKLWYTEDRGTTMIEKQWVGYTNGIAVIPIELP